MNKNPNNGLYNPLTNQSTEMILIFIIDNNKKVNEILSCHKMQQKPLSFFQVDLFWIILKDIFYLKHLLICLFIKLYFNKVTSR